VALRAGRIDEALAHFDEAKGHFAHVGADQDALSIDARIAACHLAQGNADAALDLVERTHARATSSNSVAMVAPLLERVRGEALLLRGDSAGARKALDASLAAGRARNDRFEVMQTLLSLVRLARHEGREPPAEVIGESESLRATLKVRELSAPVPEPS